MSRYDELQKLQELKAQGALSDAEFESEKQRLLNAPDPAPLGGAYSAPPPPPPGGQVTYQSTPPPLADGKLWGMEPKVYCMLLHLSQFAGFVVPFLGLALPIVMWAVNKDQNADVDAHGKVVLNWIITELIAGIVCFVLMFVVVGFPLLLVLIALGVIYPIIGALKANDGILWKYPGSIKFF